VNHKQESDRPDDADRVPALLSILEPIRQDKMQWIIPNALCKFEGNAMFGEICSRL